MEAAVVGDYGRCERRGNNYKAEGLLPANQGQNLALTAPYSPDIGGYLPRTGGGSSSQLPFRHNMKGSWVPPFCSPTKSHLFALGFGIFASRVWDAGFRAAPGRESGVRRGPRKLQAKRERLKGLPESQGQDLAVSALHVPCSLSPLSFRHPSIYCRSNPAFSLAKGGLGSESGWVGKKCYRF